jgi:type IV pilus assembly protein PilC
LEKFKYKAISDQGRYVRGIISASSEADLYAQLQTAGLELIDCKILSNKSFSSFSFSKIKIRDVIQFFIQMEQMQGAGVPLLDTLKDIRDTIEGTRFRDMVTEIHRDVSEGASLSEAMARHPKVFAPLHLSLIKAGEDTGDLTAAYKHLVKYLKWVDYIQSKIRKATRYPMVVMAVVFVTVIVMMGFVVPQIVGFIKNMKMELPFYTVGLIKTSEFFQAYWWAVIAVPIVVIVFVKIMCKVSEDFRYKIDQIMLKMPIFGPLIRKITIARYAQTFGALFSAGIDILSALRSARQTVTNMVMIDAMERVEKYVQAGQSTSEAFSSCGEFPSMVVRMLRIGEESGNLTVVLEQIAEFYTKDVDEAVEGMIAMIEPSLTALLGGIILWIVAGVFGPIYSSFENIDF